MTGDERLIKSYEELIEREAPFFNSLEDARKYVVLNSLKGGTCPACVQTVKIYPRKFNNMMALSLIWLARVSKEGSLWIHVPTQAPRRIIKASCYSKLQYWNLVRYQPNENSKHKKTSGVWSVTGRGVRVARGLKQISTIAYVVDNFVLGHSDEMVFIQQALKETFSFDQLWNDPIPIVYATKEEK